VRTYSPKPGEVDRTWHVIDAEDVVLGRLASHVATLLRGKHKPTFAPHVDTGDQAFAYRHSGYPGGLRKQSFGELLDTKPERLLEKVVKGMLPKNKLGRAQGKKLKVYAGPDHPHAAQQPKPFEIAKVSR
jgi:large subunit ribosomal protein L13